MDALQFLKDQHDEAKAIFRKLEKAKGAEASRLWEQLSSMLSLHEELEETYFYPRLREASSTEDLVLEGYQEHHVMDVLIGEIGSLKPSDEAWEPKIKVLQENTEHHIEEEESELFPKVRKVWDTDMRKRVGEEMEMARDQRKGRQRAA
jgi:hemerythrin-like domain-containing protein